MQVYQGTSGSANTTTTRDSPKRTVATNGVSAPKLGGLFEGMTSMPKLKPVNGNKCMQLLLILYISFNNKK